MEKILTIDDVFESKTYVKGNREYKTPKEYLEKFIDVVSPIAPDISVQVSGKIQNAELDKTINTAYSRILIEASNTKLKSDGLFPTFGIVIGLDTQKPVYKLYEGTVVSACTNLCVFNSNNMFAGDIFDGLSEGYDRLGTWVNGYKETFGENLDIYQRLEKNVLSKEQLEEKLGSLLRFSIDNPYLGTTPVVLAAKELYNPNSMYHIEDDEGTTDWNLYNAVTSYLSSKTDILDKASKTLLLSKFFIN